MKYIDLIFNKNTPINKNLFRNLFYSYDEISFVGYNEEIIYANKKYENIKIEKETSTKLSEGFTEYKAIIKTDSLLFLRVVIDKDELINDILIYSILTDETKSKYLRIFFKEKEALPLELQKENKLIIKVVDNHAKIIKNAQDFLTNLGYEDWDFENKMLNNLDLTITDSGFISKLKENKDFIKKYTFKKNGLDQIDLLCEYKYINGYYTIEIKK